MVELSSDTAWIFFDAIWTRNGLFHTISPLCQIQKQRDKARSKAKVKQQGKGGEETSTFGPESTFSSNSGQNFRFAVVLKPLLHNYKEGGCLSKGSNRSGSERDYLYQNHPCVWLGFFFSLLICLSWSFFFPLCSIEFTVKTQEAERFPLRKVPDKGVNEWNHRALWLHRSPCVPDGFRMTLKWFCWYVTGGRCSQN